MLLQDVYTMHGFGALTTAHTQDDLQNLYDAYDCFARMLKNTKKSEI
jgi:hypothetical protein